MLSFWKILATSGGAGYSPVAPGTAGALVASAVAFLLQHYVNTSLYTWILIALIVVFTILGILATNQVEPAWGKDPSRVVIDESVGQWIAYLFIPFGLTNLILGFVLFRLFDIWKPLGIRKMEQLKGGYGVMFDDVLAGVYANIVLQLLVTFIT